MIVTRKKKGLKYDIKVPKTVAEAHRLDRETGNVFWTDEIAKETKNVSISFSIMEERTKSSTGYKNIGGRIIFDLKINFTRKSRWVATGY